MTSGQLPPQDNFRRTGATDPTPNLQVWLKGHIAAGGRRDGPQESPVKRAGDLETIPAANSQRRQMQPSIFAANGPAPRIMTPTPRESSSPSLLSSSEQQDMLVDANLPAEFMALALPPALGVENENLFNDHLSAGAFLHFIGFRLKARFLLTILLVSLTPVIALLLLPPEIRSSQNYVLILLTFIFFVSLVGNVVLLRIVRPIREASRKTLLAAEGAQTTVAALTTMDREHQLSVALLEGAIRHLEMRRQSIERASQDILGAHQQVHANLRQLHQRLGEIIPPAQRNPIQQSFIEIDRALQYAHQLAASVATTLSDMPEHRLSDLSKSGQEMRLQLAQTNRQLQQSITQLRDAYGTAEQLLR